MNKKSFRHNFSVQFYSLVRGISCHGSSLVVVREGCLSSTSSCLRFPVSLSAAVLNRHCAQHLHLPHRRCPLHLWKYLPRCANHRLLGVSGFLPFGDDSGQPTLLDISSGGGLDDWGLFFHGYVHQQREEEYRRVSDGDWIYSPDGSTTPMIQRVLVSWVLSSVAKLCNPKLAISRVMSHDYMSDSPSCQIYAKIMSINQASLVMALQGQWKVGVARQNNRHNKMAWAKITRTKTIIS